MTLLIIFLMIPPPLRSTLFPYTTLFRSIDQPACSLLSALGSLPSLNYGYRIGMDLQLQLHALLLYYTVFCCFFNACRSEEHTSELQSRRDLVCRLLLEKKKKI